MKKTLLIIILLIASSFWNIFSNRANFGTLNLESPSSLYYNDKSTFNIEAFNSNNLNFSDTCRAYSQNDLAISLLGPRFGIKLKIGNKGSGNLEKQEILSIVNYFDIVSCFSFGYNNIALAFKWNILGERERDVNVDSITDAFLKYYEYFFIQHNDANIRNIESNFALETSYKYKDILSFCIFTDRFLSLSSQAVSFSTDSIFSSFGFALALKTPKYDSLMNLQTLVGELYANFFDIFSEIPSAKIDFALKFVLSGRIDIVMSNIFEFNNFSANAYENSHHIVKIMPRINNITSFLSLAVPLSMYSGMKNGQYIQLTLGVKFEKI